MITEDVYRDLGKAVINAYLGWEGFPFEVVIKVYALRTKGTQNVSFFVNGNLRPNVQFTINELETLAVINRYKQKREAEEEKK